MTVRVVVAPDKFKGSLGAAGVAARVAAGLRAVVPDLDVREIPVADGGEGTLDAAEAAGLRRVPGRVAGPPREPLDSALAGRRPAPGGEVGAGFRPAVVARGRPP